MTRSEIETQYKVENGIIRSPGKMEGNAVYVPHYWEIFLYWGADRDDGRILGFDIKPEDRAEFPELKGRRTVRLREDDDGFVWEL